jgi:hypothetical protein
MRRTLGEAMTSASHDVTDIAGGYAALNHYRQGVVAEKC